MSSSISIGAVKCKGCARELAAGAVVCEVCHTLAHADKLQALSMAAKSLEENGEFRLARDKWQEALALLPAEAKQAEWIRNRAAELELEAYHAENAPAKHEWARKLGPLAPIALVLAKGKSLLALFKLKFLFSLFAFLGIYWTLYGPIFGVGFAMLILIHEMGHYTDIRRRGLPAEMPVFLPGIGAYVRWEAMGVSLETRAMVSLAGPLAGWMASVACLGMWYATGNDLWAALARASTWLNIVNLTPVWILDGGQAIRAIGKNGRIGILVCALVFWMIAGESVFFLLALGAGYRLFTHDLPEQASERITYYFPALMAGLAVVMWLLPKHGM